MIVQRIRCPIQLNFKTFRPCITLYYVLPRQSRTCHDIDFYLNQVQSLHALLYVSSLSQRVQNMMFYNDFVFLPPFFSQSFPFNSLMTFFSFF